MQYEDILEVKEINVPVNNGITNPYYGIINNTRVIIKTLNNPESNRVLINELVCYRLAKLLELPIPKAGLCNIKHETVLNNVELNKKNYGIGFYSERIDKVGPVMIIKNLFDLISNKLDVLKIILFDFIICNNDRNKGNILISMKKKIWVIDHSHVFDLGPLWSALELKRRTDNNEKIGDTVIKYNLYTYKSLCDSSSTINKEQLVSIAKMFKSKISRKNIENCFKGIPREWELLEDEKEALIEYLLNRLGHIDTFVDIIYNYIVLKFEYGGEME